MSGEIKIRGEEPASLAAAAPPAAPAAAAFAWDELAAVAHAARFDVAPNPCVGAALELDGRLIARGIHRLWGGPHAEIEALAEARRLGHAGELARTTLYSTLEPCSSHGKTPPCTEALIAAGLKRVVVGALDPDARHRGRGLELLRAAGIEVELARGAPTLEQLAPHFVAWQSEERRRRPRPWLIAKWAQTRTGQLIPPPEIGNGRWISGPAALAEVQELRARVDVILTGVETVLADDPRLSVRIPAQRSEGPLRVVLDSALRTPPTAKLFAPAAAGELAAKVLILCCAGEAPARHRALESAGAEVLGLAADEAGRVQLRSVLAALWERGARRVLLEAGPTLLTACFEQGFVDQLRLYSGAVNGGRGPTLAGLLARVELYGRRDRELGGESVLEGFVKV